MASNPEAPLCNDCVLVNVKGADWTESVNGCRAELDNEHDLVKIRRLKNADAIILALEQPRPERCILLRAILPKLEPVTGRITRFADCPEVQLGGMIAPQAPSRRIPRAIL